MTQYLKKSFSVSCNSNSLDNTELQKRWDNIFKKKYRCANGDCTQTFDSREELDAHDKTCGFVSKCKLK